ncbi:hypothetical protein TrST_g4059 [Triparma strigata]|uniref:SRCR domain-containing protein n=1 Tax=Triparma strigata TaxID=1606541 RepID=A0A9W7BUV9_9STRA|nr:hypothetical protein TrST_g4059 [Triparma strigata]
MIYPKCVVVLATLLLLLAPTRAVECGLGNGPQTLVQSSTGLAAPTGQLQDASSVRIRDSSNNSPTFDSDGVVSGRIEVKPSGETNWGTIHGFVVSDWTTDNALVACREIGNELGYATIVSVSTTALDRDSAPAGSGEIWWQQVSCLLGEQALEACPKSRATGTDHYYDIGISCKFALPDTCAECPPGFYSDSEDPSPCRSCEAGKALSTSGATSDTECTACAPGKYSYHASASCTSCEAGSYSSATSAISSATCLSCEGGKTSSTVGATSNSTCTSCERGKYASSTGLTLCTSCEAGSYSNATSAISSDTCLPCELGSYSTAASPSCTKCAVGRYSSSTSATSSNTCLACAEGKASNTTGSTTCTDCKPGTYATYAASASCTACEEGKGSDSTGSTSADSCESCMIGSYSGGGSRCLPCEPGAYSEALSSSSCLGCPLGKASSTPGATSKKNCEICDLGEYTPVQGSVCKSCEEDGVSCDYRACDDDQFNNNGKCEMCDNLVSTMILAGSFLSFAVAAYYSAAIATNRRKMMQLKVAATFFQTAELTTLIKVSWPAIVFFTLPFQLPITDAKCLASSSGWNQVHTFYAYIYGPIVVFAMALLSASGTKPRSSERKKVASLLTILVSLWYSPLLQIIASMYECFQDPERENRWYLSTDPSVSCEPSPERTIIKIHSLALAILVGFGFPLLSFLKIRSLRKAGKLDFDSSLANLFQFYNTRMPNFETVQFFRKGLLILVLTWFNDNPVIQSISSLGINGSFLLLLSCTHPFVYYPTSNSRRNLFQTAEVSSTVTCLIGNTLALLGALTVSDQSFVDLLGGVLATTNILFFMCFMLSYNRELGKASRRELEWQITSRRCIENENLGYELRDAVEEWNLLVMSLDDESLEEQRRLQVVDEMPFVKSRIVAAMRIFLMEREERHTQNVTFQITEAFDEEGFKEKSGRFERILGLVNEDFEKLVGEAHGPFTVLEIAQLQKLDFVSGLLEGGTDGSIDVAERGGKRNTNPLQQVEMTTVESDSKQEQKTRTKKKSAGKASVPTTITPPPPPPPPPPRTSPGSDPWMMTSDSNGNLIYVNKETNEISYEKPKIM